MRQLLLNTCYDCGHPHIGYAVLPKLDDVAYVVEFDEPVPTCSCGCQSRKVWLPETVLEAE